MRVIANENIAATAIRRLRQNGHDVLSVKESMQGADDESIVQRAETEQRLVVRALPEKRAILDRRDGETGKQ